jgi:hypothetical protein
MNVKMHERIDALKLEFQQTCWRFVRCVTVQKPSTKLFSSNGKNLHLIRESVQQIATAINMFNNTAPKLDNTLPAVLHDSVMFVNLNIQSLFDHFGRLKDQIRAMDVLGRNAPPVRSESAEFYIATILAYPPIAAHWRDPPDIHPIHQFMNSGGAVDYRYRVMPKLEAHLTAMQSKIVNIAADLLQKLVERKNSVEQTATR